jgi:hypothetical protein
MTEASISRPVLGMVAGNGLPELAVHTLVPDLGRDFGYVHGSSSRIFSPGWPRPDDANWPPARLAATVTRNTSS